MKNNIKFLVLYPLSILCFLLLVGCNQHKQNAIYRVGVSQCSDDAWRTKMNEEMKNELIFHPDIQLSIRQANDNSQLQCLQIDSFIAEQVDLLIVSPNEAEEVKPAVSRAYDAGIPVIVADRQVTGEKYTAFIGGDNYAVGLYMADWLIHQASLTNATSSHPLQVIEIMGLAGSTPCVWRHKGLMDGLKNVKNVRLMGSGNADWFAAPARVVTDSLLRLYPQTNAIVAQNDIMAIAAAEVAEKVTYARNIYHQGDTPIYILGTDAMTGKGGGVEAIVQGKIDASVTYASRGDMVIQTAAKILHHEPFLRDTILPTMLVDASVAESMLLMSHEIEHNIATITTLQERIKLLWDMSKMQRIILYTIAGCFLAILIILLGLIYEYRYRRRIRAEREQQARLVAKQQQQLEHMTVELEQTKVSQSQDELFMQRLQELIEKHINDSNLSIEIISDKIGVSRTQLFRKTKALTGVSPIELIRHVRLRKAQQLLRKSNATIQEIAYEVGFTSASYFAKCYKEFFGINPSAEQQYTGQYKNML